ncbi:MAG TPA: aldose 1-epimerase family protein [Nocardioidaceae bacterium]|nr:aldose 1-epimerase family protein [Nocardioidaceae bacterium]
MVAPSGEQFEVSGGGYRAVVTECGAGLRVLEYDGRPLVAGYAEAEFASAGRGQLLLPWPNRIEDGAYTFQGRDLQLPVSEVARNNASHGLARWASWTVEEHTAQSVSLLYRLMAQSGYPWTVDLHVLYDLSADGLTVTVTASNMSDSPAPYAQGAHPYLVAAAARTEERADERVDHWELRMPADTRLLTNERKLPVGRQPVDDTAYDFRIARPIRDLQLDDAFTDLRRADDGRVEVELRNPRTGAAVVLWMDDAHSWMQVYSGDDLGPDLARRSLAIEPMTAPANAFRTSEGLITLGPAGADSDEHSSSWGIGVR